MKFARIVTMIIAGAGLLALAAPAEAQSRGRRGGTGGNVNRGDNNRGGDFNRGRFHRGGSRVNFYFGGFGYPYYGYPYYGGFYGGYYPYYGGYGYPVRAYYTYDPRGVYEGRVANPSDQRTNDGGGKDLSMAARVQQQLAQGGYYRGEIDGVVGDGTRQAIRSYERDNGLPEDGRIDDQLLATLGLG